MAAKKGGLNMGKGLQSLIPGGKESAGFSKEKESKSFLKEAKTENAAKTEAQDNADGIIEAKISLVIPNADQPRKEFDDSSLSELAESIKN